MTKKELFEKIKDLPDNTEVLFEDDVENIYPAKMSITQVSKLNNLFGNYTYDLNGFTAIVFW